MATKATLDLLLSHTQFAKLNATEQYNRLTAYYSRWFEPGFDIHAIDNIRASQRLTTYAKAMNIAVGVAILTLLTEASAGPATRSLAGDALRFEEDQGIPTTGEPIPNPEPDAPDVEPAPAHPAVLEYRNQVAEATPSPPVSAPELTPESDQPAPEPAGADAPEYRHSSADPVPPASPPGPARTRSRKAQAR